MNELIENILSNFTIKGRKMPYAFVYYRGNASQYITYNNVSKGNSYYNDNELSNYVDYYDFDIYSKSNYLDIEKGLKEILEQNNFEWQPSMTSSDMYEEDTGFFHKTLCFAYIRSKED